MIGGFQKFLLRGNLIDLAVGVLIGAAFGKVVDSFTSGLILPLVGIFGGVPDFTRLTFTVNGSIFRYGAFLTALLSFILTAAIIYFFVIVPFNHLLGAFQASAKGSGSRTEQRGETAGRDPGRPAGPVHRKRAFSTLERVTPPLGHGAGAQCLMVWCGHAPHSHGGRRVAWAHERFSH